LDYNILVNPINCYAVSGAGMAKTIRQSIGDRGNEAYLQAQVESLGKLRPGSLYPFVDSYDQWILNATTKDHWKDPSKYEWVQSCLQCINTFLDTYKPPLPDGAFSMALPLLGCGKGGLDPLTVFNMTGATLSKYTDNITIYHIGYNHESFKTHQTNW
jgi:O-acetyl-ADP-ribose deacetylase (regulator of RNase III)